MATFRKRAGNWQAIIRRDGYPYQSRTFDTKAEAETWARDEENKMDRGTWRDAREAEATTLREALDRYEREVTPRKKGAVQERKRIAAWKRDPLALRSLASIRGADLAAWRDKRLASSVSPTTVRNDLALISHLFNVAAREWGLESLVNPIERIKMPAPAPARTRRLDATPDEEGKTEEVRLMAAAEAEWPWLVPIIRLALETGMRQGELLALEWSDIKLPRPVAHVVNSKNDHSRRDRTKGRDVPLSPTAIEVLEELRKPLSSVERLPVGPVFPFSAQVLYDHWCKAVDKAGLVDLHFHDLRHEATSRFFEKGLELMQVATITGHKTLAMLRRYTHLRADDLAQKLG